MAANDPYQPFETSRKMESISSTELGLAEGWAIFVVYGIASLMLFASALVLWRAFQNLAKFWSENERASTMHLSQFLVAFMSGSVFDAQSQPLYKKSRDQFGLSIGVFVLAMAFTVYGGTYLLEPLEKWFETFLQ